MKNFWKFYNIGGTFTNQKIIRRSNVMAVNFKFENNNNNNNDIRESIQGRVSWQGDM